MGNKKKGKHTEAKCKYGDAFAVKASVEGVKWFKDNIFTIKIKFEVNFLCFIIINNMSL